MCTAHWTIEVAKFWNHIVRLHATMYVGSIYSLLYLECRSEVFWSRELHDPGELIEVAHGTFRETDLTPLLFRVGSIQLLHAQGGERLYTCSGWGAT